MTAFNMSIGERIWLWRRRQRLSLVDAALRLGVARGIVVDWEADRVAPPEDMKRRTLSIVPTTTEKLRLLRRRSRLGSRGAAAAYGVSHVSLLRLEQQGDEKLLMWYLRENEKTHLQMTERELHLA